MKAWRATEAGSGWDEPPPVRRLWPAAPSDDDEPDDNERVLRYLASRLTYNEIASDLFISVNTLKSHVKAIFRKLGASTRSEAVDNARRSGLL